MLGCCCLHILSKGLTPRETFRIQKHHTGGRQWAFAQNSLSLKQGFFNPGCHWHHLGGFKIAGVWSHPQKIWCAWSGVWPGAKRFLEAPRVTPMCSQGWEFLPSVSWYSRLRPSEWIKSTSLLHFRGKCSWVGGLRVQRFGRLKKNLTPRTWRSTLVCCHMLRAWRNSWAWFKFAFFFFYNMVNSSVLGFYLPFTPPLFCNERFQRLENFDVPCPSDKDV